MEEFINKLCDKLNDKYVPEIVPVIIENYSRKKNCFGNVNEKIKIDGGKIHYGWIIHTNNKFFYEAERHAVWENENEDLIDITPNQTNSKEIIFLPDDNYVDNNEVDIDNVKINITKNKVVDDFIILSKSLSDLYNCFTQRIDDDSIYEPEFIKPFIQKYSNLKDDLLLFINAGKDERSVCFCSNNKNYKNCHGKNIKLKIDNDFKEIKKIRREIECEKRYKTLM